MSFRSILTSIFHGVEKVAGIAVPIVEAAASIALPPAAASLLNNALNAAEDVIRTADSGAAKSESVTQIITDELVNLPEVAAVFGQGAKVTWDPALLQTAINDSVAAKNSVTAWVQSIKKA